jgi:hypothetical protein
MMRVLSAVVSCLFLDGSLCPENEAPDVRMISEK